MQRGERPIQILVVDDSSYNLFVMKELLAEVS
jgi:CheY-like chemotaxis protein